MSFRINSRIYFDMDGVLANFIDGADKLTKKIGYNKYDNNFWLNIKDNNGKFYYELDVIDEVKNVIDKLYKEDYDINILSKVPYKCKTEAILGKSKWLNKYFNGIFNNIIFIPSYNSKRLYCKPRDILIDDYIENVLSWRYEGGIGIHYELDKTNLQEKLNNIFEMNPSVDYKLKMDFK